MLRMVEMAKWRLVWRISMKFVEIMVKINCKMALKEETEGKEGRKR